MIGMMADNIRDSGLRIKWLESVSISGRMAAPIKDNLVTIKDMDMAYMCGQMADRTLDSGGMANSTDLVSMKCHMMKMMIFSILSKKKS